MSPCYRGASRVPLGPWRGTPYATRARGLARRPIRSTVVAMQLCRRRFLHWPQRFGRCCHRLTMPRHARLGLRRHAWCYWSLVRRNRRWCWAATWLAPRLGQFARWPRRAVWCWSGPGCVLVGGGNRVPLRDTRLRGCSMDDDAYPAARARDAIAEQRGQRHRLRGARRANRLATLAHPTGARATVGAAIALVHSATGKCNATQSAIAWSWHQQLPQTQVA